MEILILLGLLAVPIITAIPAWQRLGHTARIARELANDLDVLMRDGDRARALSVIEEASPCIAGPLRAAILAKDPTAIPLQCRIEMPMARDAASMFRVGGWSAVLGGAVGIFIEPAATIFLVPLGISMLVAGAMLKYARMDMEEAHAALLRIICQATA